MKTHILRLGSVIPNGVGGPEAGAIDLIYSFLLQEYKQTFYSYIHVNQIGDDLEEVILKDRKKIYINIRYPNIDFQSKSSKEKNFDRLDVVHTALLRIAEKESNLNVQSLIKIKEYVLAKDFHVDLLYKKFEERKSKLVGKILIQPEPEKFNFYFAVESTGKNICKLLIYEGKCTDFYIPTIFAKGKWKDSSEFVICDKEKQIEIHIFIDTGFVEYRNLTRYEKAPFFEMMKATISTNESDKVYKDWLHSLPPAIAAAISNEPN